MVEKSYRDKKIDFVSNHSGGSISEINLVTLVAPAAILLWSALQTRRSFFTPYRPTALLVDFLLNVLAILSATTAYSSVPLLLDILLISPAILISLLPSTDLPTKTASKHSKPKSSPPHRDDATLPRKDKSNALPVRSFLTHYRGSMLIVTCLAILAVDFPIFPRRFAKVENWGTSLMDLGVGSFVFSAGVVSARSVLQARASASTNRASFSARLAASARHSAPLFILGLIRLYSVKGLDYAEHVTEYGVHWNFFFTLALLPPFVELSDLFTNHVIPSYEVLAFLIVLIYEILLDNTDLKGYILVAPRGSDLLSKNREGVFSFIGYLAIFLAGRGTGTAVITSGRPPPQNAKRVALGKHAWRERKSLLIKMTIRSVGWILLFYASTHYALAALNVSRRLANLPYVIWINAFNNSYIVLFCLIETIYFPPTWIRQGHGSVEQDGQKSTSQVMQAFNSNGLAIFLIANLMTGLVNLTLDTLSMSPAGAMGILVMYSVAITAVAMGLHWCGVKIKI